MRLNRLARLSYTTTLVAISLTSVVGFKLFDLPRDFARALFLASSPAPTRIPTITPTPTPTTIGPTPSATPEPIASLAERVDELGERLAAVETRQALDDERVSAIVLAQVRKSRTGIEELEKKVKRLAQVVIDRPEDVVSDVLLREQLESARAESDAKLEAMGRDIDRGYDLMKFIFGGLVLGLVSLGLTSYVQTRRSA